MPRTLLVATDFSETASRARDQAVLLARALGAQLALVHVTTAVVVLPPPLDAVPLATLFPNALRKLEERLETEAEQVRAAGVECTTALLDGIPHAEIARQAEELSAEMIVLGTHGGSGIRHVVLGSVAERVLHRAPCPVLLVPDHRPARPPR